MIRIAAVALICVIAPVNFALTQVQDDQLAKQLAAISFKLSDKYFSAMTANRRWCPIMGGRWEDHSLPEIVTRDRPSRHFFHESKMMCNGAHIALAILQEIAELPNPHESELFVFTAFVKDLTNLEDFDRYRAHLIGPFVESHECEAWERSFHEHEVGTKPCELWSLKP